MTDRPDISADEARAALDRASSIRVTSPRDVRTLVRVTLGIGVAMALVLVLIRLAGDNPVAFGLGMFAYAAVVVGLLAYNRRVGSAPRGYGLRYGLGVAGTALVYTVGVVLLSGGTGSWGLTAALAVLTVLPSAVAAWSISRLAR